MLSAFMVWYRQKVIEMTGAEGWELVLAGLDAVPAAPFSGPPARTPLVSVPDEPPIPASVDPSLIAAPGAVSAFLSLATGPRG